MRSLRIVPLLPILCIFFLACNDGIPRPKFDGAIVSLNKCLTECDEVLDRARAQFDRKIANCDTILAKCRITGSCGEREIDAFVKCRNEAIAEYTVALTTSKECRAKCINRVSILEQ